MNKIISAGVVFALTFGVLAYFNVFTLVANAHDACCPISGTVGSYVTYTFTGTPTTINDPYVYIGSNGSQVVVPQNPVAQNAVISADNQVTICVGDDFVIMDGVTAKDNGGTGMDLTQIVTASGAVNTAVAGRYTVVYKVTGSNGNTVSKRVRVVVEDCAAVDPEPVDTTEAPIVPGGTPRGCY